MNPLIAILSLCLCALCSGAQPLLPPRQAAARSLSIAIQTNRVAFVTASKLIGNRLYCWTNLLYTSNVAAIVTLPGSALIAPPGNPTITISQPIRVLMLRGPSLNEMTPFETNGTLTVTIPADQPQEFFRLELQPQTARVTWTASPSFQVSGYKVYYGPSSGAYNQIADVGLATNYIPQNLTPGSRYFFRVAAYDAGGVEAASDEVNYWVPVNDPVPTISTR